jgi:hypothetical protein
MMTHSSPACDSLPNDSSMTRRHTLLLPAAAFAQDADPRNLTSGTVIPDEGYADQPYVTIMPNGHWVACTTTGKGVEGEGGQHVIVNISRDKGETWSAPIDVEPANGPEASWAVPILTSYGRLYIFYTYNRDNIRRIPRTENEYTAKRVDTLGAWCFKYSDDGGLTWSRERYEIPLRPWIYDNDNNFDGRQRFFWSVCKPLLHNGSAYIGFARISRWGMPGVLVRSRGFLVRSANILTERDASKIQWTELPDSPEGLRAPKGSIAEETNLTALSDGTLYAVYRTIDGYLCAATSKDQGKTFTPPAYATYSPNGRRIKNPRAFSFVRKFSNGKYLLWFHFNGGEAAHARERWDYYRDRNPGWICGGIERGGTIHWSEPEILLYDDDPAMRFSYPDFIEDQVNGETRYWITETNKEIARCHKLDANLLEGLWNQHGNRTRARQGLLLAQPSPGPFQLPALATSPGFTLDFHLFLKELTPGQLLIDSPALTVKTGNRFNLEVTLSQGQQSAQWESDYGTFPGTLKTNTRQHVAITFDGGPKLILFTIDGIVNDGGPTRQFGWGRFPTHLVTSPCQARSQVENMHLYNRPLRTSETVGNFRASS